MGAIEKGFAADKDWSFIEAVPRVDHTPAELDPASKLLLKAAAYLEDHGHCQDGSPGDNAGRVCVIGALTHVYGGGFLLSPGSHGEQACKRLEKLITSDNCIPRWSDSTPTPEVLSTMRRAALGL